MIISQAKFKTDAPSKCDACGRAIDAGESVHVVTDWDGGEASAFVECPACERLLADFGELFIDGDGVFRKGCVASAMDGSVTSAELLAQLEFKSNEQNNEQA